MRIAEVASRDFGRRKNHKDRRPLRALCLPRPTCGVMHADTLSIENASPEAGDTCRWLEAYVRLIPDDFARDRVNQAFSGNREDVLSEKLLLYML
jgi:hypothetical protein